MVHCDKRGSEAFMGHMSHMFKFEQGAASAIANVFINKVHNFDDGTFSIDEIREGIRGKDLHEPRSQLVCIENTHNFAGLVLEDLKFLKKFMLLIFALNRWESSGTRLDRRAVKSLQRKQLETPHGRCENF
jgi:threonine aldolase